MADCTGTDPYSCKAGAACSNRDGFAVDDYIWVQSGDAAPCSGTVQHICFYDRTNADNVRCGSFQDDGGNNLTVRGSSGNLGTANGEPEDWSAPGDFTAFPINSGDYVGTCYSAGECERDTSGAGYWYKSDTNCGSWATGAIAMDGFSADRIISVCFDILESAGGGVIPTPYYYRLIMGSLPIAIIGRLLVQNPIMSRRDLLKFWVWLKELF